MRLEACRSVFGEVHMGNPGIRYFIACGSYLRKNGEVILDSLSKVDAVFVPGKQTQVWLEGQPVTNVFLRAAEKPETVVLNGVSVEVFYDEMVHVVRLSIKIMN